MVDRRARSGRHSLGPRRPTNSAVNVTYNSDLTRISTSGPDFLSTIMDGDLGDDLDVQETRPFLLSLPRFDDRQEDYELSVAWRATV